jgi:hypothetical protein
VAEIGAQNPGSFAASMVSRPAARRDDAGTRQMLLGTGVWVWQGGPGDYLLSASTRRSTSSSTVPVLGRLRLSSWSLSSALVRPS